MHSGAAGCEFDVSCGAGAPLFCFVPAQKVAAKPGSCPRPGPMFAKFQSICNAAAAQGTPRANSRMFARGRRHCASHDIAAVLFALPAPARIRPVNRLTRILAIVLAAVLLINQSAAFAYEQLHGTATEAVSDDSTLPPHDGGSSKDGCGHCAHGSHYQSHFLGHLTEAAPDSLLPLAAPMASVFMAPCIPIASLEAPYRPPRNPGFLRTV